MLDIRKLEEIASAYKMEVALVRDDRITIKYGMTEVDFFQLDAFDVTYDDEAKSMLSRDEADGWAWYRDAGYAPRILVTQAGAEELAAGASFPAAVMQQNMLSKMLGAFLAT